MEKPYNGRATLYEKPYGLEIIIPTKKNWFLIIFIGAWLGGWAMGEIFALSTLFFTNFMDIGAGSPSLFLLFWLCGWTVGGFFALRTFWWNAFGKEVITFRKGTLIIERKGLLFSQPKIYDLAEITKIRVQEEENSFWGNRNSFDSSNFLIGTIRFNYGFKTVKFGGGIDEAEAYFILEKLKAKKILTDENF